MPRLVSVGAAYVCNTSNRLQRATRAARRVQRSTSNDFPRQLPTAMPSHDGAVDGAAGGGVEFFGDAAGEEGFATGTAGHSHRVGHE